jgi:hypothetical protein
MEANDAVLYLFNSEPLSIVAGLLHKKHHIIILTPANFKPPTVLLNKFMSTLKNVDTDEIFFIGNY